MFWGVCNIAYLYNQYAFDAAERYLQWYTLLNLRAWHVKVKWKWKWKSLGRVWLFVTPWTIQSMEFSRPEYWSGYPLHSSGNLPNPGIEPRSLALQVDSLPSELSGKPKNNPFSSRSSWLRNQTRVSWTSGWFFTNWAMRVAWKVLMHCMLSLQLSRTLPRGS